MQNSISIYDNKGKFNYKKFFLEKLIQIMLEKVYIDYINNRIIIFFITSYEIYIFNIT